MGLIGHYAPGDLEFLLVQDGTVLMEVQDVSVSVSVPRAPSGSGLGKLKNRYHKVTGPPEGTFSISRNELSAEERGELFMRLLLGNSGIIQENVVSGSLTHTLSHTPISVYEIRVGRFPFSILEKNMDYVVNWMTGVITFTAALTGDAVVKYATADRDWHASNLLVNGNFESDISGVWYGRGGGVLARESYGDSPSHIYAGDYALAVTTTTTNDGVHYDYPIPLVPNRDYLLRFWCKGTTGKTLAVNVWDGSTLGTTYTVNTGATSLTGTTWRMHEFYILADDVQHDGLLIRNTSATPGGPFYIDQMSLREKNPVYDLMNASLATGFEFEIWARRVSDGTIIYKLTGCQVYSDAFASGDAYSESIEGQFLGFIPQAEGVTDVAASGWWIHGE